MSRLKDGTTLVSWCSIHRRILLSGVGVNRWGTMWYSLTPDEVDRRDFYGDPLPTELDRCHAESRYGEYCDGWAK